MGVIKDMFGIIMKSDIEGNRLLANYKDFKEYIENKFYNERIVREVTVIKRSSDF